MSTSFIDFMRIFSRTSQFCVKIIEKNGTEMGQIEKELLAIVFACQRFQFFQYGREFTIESDHKLLKTLIQRDIDDATVRLQIMYMYLLKYPKMSVVYKPGREMLIADRLLRAHLPEVKESGKLIGVIHSVCEKICANETNYNFYRIVMSEDEKYNLSVCRKWVANVSST